ncbi:hypothetical protein N473_16740 [Pseudoalteromonas luteoviolacea CPMOR-1]|uniref:Uncharacterized protein n=1 Tax=Pseudoalteromonas luteoviolacea CPMOR-1 TaxID=1365248 RepID=A0A162AXU8_9GAMM|nr:hypothetical protein N473_16740 [Pseudoalteromonas luteoviolacea CPMOR-1]
MKLTNLLRKALYFSQKNHINNQQKTINLLKIN